MTLIPDLHLYRPAISTHTPLAGRDQSAISDAYGEQLFLLTRPLRDVTGYPGLWLIFPSFLLTRPLRDVTSRTLMTWRRWKFLLTRPLRDVTPKTSLVSILHPISTHTPLAGRDPV